MTEKKSLVEETLIQMKDLENVISENAKGILQSTMKEEISELVKESLMEQSDEDEEDEDETNLPTDDEEDEDETNLPTDDEEDEDETSLPTDDEEDVMNFDSDLSGVDEPIDLTKASDEEILKVFKGMGEDDGIIIKKDGNYIDLEDTDEDVEYKIQLGESDLDEDDNYDNEFVTEYDQQDKNSENIYELELTDPDKVSTMDDMIESDEMLFNDEEDFTEPFEMYEPKKEVEENIYEIDMNSGGNDEDDEWWKNESDNIQEDEFDFEGDEFDSEGDEDSDLIPMEGIHMDEEDNILPEGLKRKKLKFGKEHRGGPKFTYNKTTGGFKETMKQGPKSVGTGSAKKFKYGEGENAGSSLGKNKIVKGSGVKKAETKEASRTLGNGKFWGRQGLPKPKSAPRHLRTESQELELNLLREKNEEYRKALNLFRGKLNEVAVFNSNLAYATRLFTEHSTTKQEKINILRRFDSVENLRESKTLYKTIKDELSSQTGNKPSKESIQEQIEKTPSSGSAASLIESKTYENPQFLRMKDLMVKMNIKK
jgi:hypothetical protein